MPDHLIFDYFTSTTSDEDASVPEEPTSSTAAHMRAGRSHLQHRRRPCRPGLRRRLLCGRPVRRRWVEPISPSVQIRRRDSSKSAPDCPATSGKPTSRACVIPLRASTHRGSAVQEAPRRGRPPDHLPALTDPGVVDRAVTRPVPASPSRVRAGRASSSF